MRFFRPTEESSGTRCSVSLDRATRDRKLEADHRRAEPLLELVRLLVQVFFGPGDELVPIARHS